MRVRVLVALLVGLALLPVGGGAGASCAAPYLELGGADVTQVVPGQLLVVEGRAFVKGCNDGGGFGCTAEKPERAYDDVLLEIRQGSRSWELGDEDAGSAEDDRLGQVTWEVTLPTGLRPGTAMLVALVGRSPGATELPIESTEPVPVG